MNCHCKAFICISSYLYTVEYNRLVVNCVLLTGKLLRKAAMLNGKFAAPLVKWFFSLPFHGTTHELLYWKLLSWYVALRIWKGQTSLYTFNMNALFNLQSHIFHSVTFMWNTLSRQSSNLKLNSSLLTSFGHADTGGAHQSAALPPSGSNQEHISL